MFPVTLVAVCTYNELANVPELSRRILDAIPDCQLLFIDDNSPDGTAAWIERAMATDDRIKLIVRKHKRGLGGATRTAFQYAVDHGYELLLNLDGDLSHAPEVLPTLRQIAIDQPQIDVVVGTRYGDGGSIEGWPWRRRVMSRLVNRFATSVLRLPVSDCSGSLRCYRVAALARLNPQKLRSESYAILEEVLVRLRQRGSEMAEVPIQFTDRVRGSSKLTTRESIRSAWQLLKVALTRA